MTKPLSPREQEIIELCVQGLTNQAIAAKLGLSLGTVNTYWLRIRMKVGGSARTDTVVRVIKQQAEEALRASDVEKVDLSDLLVVRDQERVDLRAALALVNLALEQTGVTVWATDQELRISILANGESSSTHFGFSWELGESVEDAFVASDLAHAAVSAHERALLGETVVEQIGVQTLKVMPMTDEAGAVIGCVGTLTGDQTRQ